MPTLPSLGELSLDTFLSDYWQKKPVVLRGVFPDWQCPLTPDELAGLAMEEEVESRLVLERDQGKPWQLKAGPFSDEDFDQLPENGWSLLVQAVDHWVPEATALLDQFRFIPNWRLDDLMVSYAPDGASVGPHFDFYDVFLVQGLGKRHWQLGPKCNAQSARVKDTPLNILADFKADAEYILEPGDVLYVPPQFAHWGVAQGDCMTYSVGFRAPSHAEILDDYVAELCSRLPEHLRYQDPATAPTQTPGLLGNDALSALQALLTEQINQPQQLAQWFGKYMTEPKYLPDQGTETAPDQEALSQAAAELQEHDGPLFQAPDARFAYFESQLFANGERYECDAETAALLANTRCISGWQAQVTQPGVAALLSQLVARDLLWFEDPTAPEGEDE
ncbi:cupin domain-containing protein [Simiduia sp. 21SJ11W-1]|uniref:cupin domain-containing protein n=1 Tax=Simiduia sp. 21SJ11W-1 TaxID=2909669 RepID=UPI0020A134D5|nr:cupin domain-containing protein [Simiduia sp. 21SJ11W-1]UTA49593.1 cupin domain-containing protein [Simiduia sp. 21SJ11W-1]